LGIDFGDAAPASSSPPTTLDTKSGGTPARVASLLPPTSGGNSLDDLLGVFDSGPAPDSSGLVSGFERPNFGSPD